MGMFVVFERKTTKRLMSKNTFGRVDDANWVPAIIACSPLDEEDSSVTSVLTGEDFPSHSTIYRPRNRRVVRKDGFKRQEALYFWSKIGKETHTKNDTAPQLLSKSTICVGQVHGMACETESTEDSLVEDLVDDEEAIITKKSNERQGLWEIDTISFGLKDKVMTWFNSWMI